jgi:tetratricopeptide (TPR) repeat protein
VCCTAAFNSPALAHDGPEADIEELTQRMKIEGESADLLLQRAIEYNVLSKSAEAIKDLRRALDFDPDSPTIQRELSRAYFVTGKTNEALDLVSHAIKHAEEGPERAFLRMVRCEILRARKDYAKAAEDTDKAIREHPANAEWYHTRSLLQQQLGLKKERIKGLQDGIEATGSGLLEADLIDAMIDGGKAEAAMARIEQELSEARLQSSWLIRRARARLALKPEDEAKADLEAALVELNRRITPHSRDPLLLADRGRAYDLLGKTEEAKKDYEQAREKGMGDEWMRERLRAFKEAEDKKKDPKGGGNSRRRDQSKSEKKDDEKKTDEKPDDSSDDKKDEKPGDDDSK